MSTHKARKRFGQNFLQDFSIIDEIIGSMEVQPGQHWVEIGPGLGALTEPMLKQNIHMDIIELDRDLVAYLQDKFKDFENLRIHNYDALDFDFSCFSPAEPVCIVGNLPYNISTPLLFHLLKFSDQIDTMYFMLQKEVVDRICASPGSKKYGRLSVMMQYHCETDFLFDVHPECFNPVPKVMSAVIKLTPHSTPPFPAKNLELLNNLVTQAFSQRRKTLRNSLKNLINETQFKSLEIDPGIRAEQLSVAQFVQLSNYLCDPVSKNESQYRTSD